MGVHKETLSGLRESYEKVRRLVDEQSRHDPPSEPHASRYAAKRVLERMFGTLEASPAALPRRVPLLAAVRLTLGTLAVDTDELNDGERHLVACLELFDPPAYLQPDCVTVALTALNQLGILWSHRDDPLRSKEYLDRAEALYKEFTASKAKPYDLLDLFENADAPSPRAELNLEKVHTLTLYYLAQIYGSLEDYLKSAAYCHTTLRRQLEFDDYDPIDWALNSATLSQFFMEKNGFKQARHHLAAASFALDRHEENIMAREDAHGEEHDARVEVLKHRSADVARCWAKYGLMLLSTSKDRLMHHADDDQDTMACSLSSDLAKLKLSENSTVSTADLKQLSFPSLDLSLYENQITYTFVLTYEDAKAVFHNTKSWIDRATSYYTIENLASDHLQIMQDASQLYKFLAFFEDDEDRQAKMHKRRIDLLEKVIKDLNPTYYMSFLRQIWYELGEIYQEILSIKMEKIQTSNEHPSPHALNKINHCAEQSIKYYSNFLNSLKQPMSEEMPKKFPPETEKAAIGAYFQIGSLYMKIIVLDKQVQVKNYEETLKAYKSLVDYCDANEAIGQSMKTEFDICKEMIDLLPFKIQKIKREIPVQ